MRCVSATRAGGDRPVLARVEKDAHVSLTAKGGVGNVLDLARQVGLSKYGNFDFNEIEADGEIEFSLELACQW